MPPANLPPITVVHETAGKAAQTPFTGLTPKYVGKFSIAVMLFGMSMYYLATGRKEADMGKMITGAVLALASLLFL